MRVRFTVFPVLFLLSGCSVTVGANADDNSATPKFQYDQYAIAAPTSLMIIDGPAVRCNATGDQTRKDGVLSSGLLCTDDRTGTVSFRHAPGGHVGSGYFILDDGTRGHIIFVSHDGKSYKGKLKTPRRRPDYFMPPNG